MATYTALLLGAQARYTTAVASASSPSGVPRRSYACPSIERERERPRIREPDVLDRHARDAPRQINRVAAAIEHAAQPVKRRIRIRAAHRLVQRGDLVVELIAALVEAPMAAARHLLRDRHAEQALRRRLPR